MSSFFFFFNDTATTEIYTLSYTTLFRSPSPRQPEHGESCRDDRHHDDGDDEPSASGRSVRDHMLDCGRFEDRKSTRLNSSHGYISYAVFCLKKKNTSPFFSHMSRSFLAQ